MPENLKFTDIIHSLRFSYRMNEVQTHWNDVNSGALSVLEHLIALYSRIESDGNPSHDDSTPVWWPKPGEWDVLNSGLEALREILDRLKCNEELWRIYNDEFEEAIVLDLKPPARKAWWRGNSQALQIYAIVWRTQPYLS